MGFNSRFKGLTLYPHRFILAPKAMQKIKGSETKKYTYAHSTTSPLYVQFMCAQQETHNKTCCRKQKMREIHGQVHFLIACHTTRHQGRVWCIQGLLYRTAVRRYQDTTRLLRYSRSFHRNTSQFSFRERRTYVRIRTTFRRFHVD